MAIVVYLDESGDLGWTLDKPYRQGGSSRHLTIAAILVASEKKHLVKRLVKNLYQKMGKSKADEIKWVDIDQSTRLWLASEISSLATKLGDDMRLMSITVNKQKVLPHIRTDPNKLYNYMVNLLLVGEMAKHAVVSFIPDQRSIKVENGNSMHDYIQTQLWFEKNAATQLSTRPTDSKISYGLQCADMLAGIIQSHFEDNKSSCFNALQTKTIIKRLFF